MLGSSDITGQGGSIFISYRRSDSADVVGRIYDSLIKTFQTKRVFKDVDSIPIGRDFKEDVLAAIAASEATLIIIGPRWASVKDEHGVVRINDPHDNVRIEVEAALNSNCQVIPVLVGGAQLPSAEELPASICRLISFNALGIRPDPDFHADVTKLSRHLWKLTNPGEMRPGLLKRAVRWTAILTLLLMGLFNILMGAFFLHHANKDLGSLILGIVLVSMGAAGDAIVVYATYLRKAGYLKYPEGKKWW